MKEDYFMKKELAMLTKWMKICTKDTIQYVASVSETLIEIDLKKAKELLSIWLTWFG